MAIDKISFKSGTTSVNNVVKPEEKKVSVSEVDNEKKLSMEAMVGLGAAAVIATVGIVHWVRRGKAPKTPGGSTSVPTPTPTPATTTGSTDSVAGKLIEEVKELANGKIKKVTRNDQGHKVKEVITSADGTKVYKEAEYVHIPAKIRGSQNFATSVKLYDDAGNLKYERAANMDFLHAVTDKFPTSYTTNSYKNGVKTSEKEFEFFNTPKECRYYMKKNQQFNPKTGIRSSTSYYDSKNILSKEIYDDIGVDKERFDFSYKYETVPVGKKPQLEYKQVIRTKADNSSEVTKLYGNGIKVFAKINSKGQQTSSRKVDVLGRTTQKVKYGKNGRKTIVDFTYASPEDKVGRAKVTKKFTNKHDEDCTNVFYLGNENKNYDRIVTLDNLGNEIGEVTWAGGKKYSKFQGKDIFSSVLYDENGKKVSKNLNNECQSIRETFYPSGRIKTYTVTDEPSGLTYTESLSEKPMDCGIWQGLDPYFQAGITRRKDGEITELVKQYKDGDIIQMGVEYLHNGNKELRMLHRRGEFDTVALFDKAGNIIGEGGNTGTLPDMAKVFAEMESIGETKLLNELYKPNGQCSLF